MTAALAKLNMIVGDKVLRNRVLFTLGALVAFRVLSVIPIPGVDAFRLQSLLAGNEFLGLLNIFSGGGLSNLSIVMLGVGPYITSSIIMQLLTIMVPKLKALYQEEGEAGRRKFAQYSRMLAVPLALIQAYGFITLLKSQNVVSGFTPFDYLLNVIVILGGSMLLMWIGELISEYGIGNGVSLIIFAGIVARIPTVIAQFGFTFDVSQIPLYAAFLVATLLVILGVVIVTEAERPIPITYAKQVRGNKVYGGASTYLPLRINQAGVIPIIFALSLLLFPNMILQFLAKSSISIVHAVSTTVLTFLNNPWVYAALYFFLVFIFTYFYTAVTFDPHSIAENLQKSGAFIPGVRPGQSTSEHIARILTRLTLVGAIFLGLIAVLPLAMRALTGLTSISIGGTALLIVVSVVVDLIKKVDAQLSIREY